MRTRAWLVRAAGGRRRTALQPLRGGRDEARPGMAGVSGDPLARVRRAAGEGSGSRLYLKTEFLPRRINFGSRDNLGAWSASSAPFGCCLLIFEAKPLEEETHGTSQR